eukprot:m.41073 g.41073  ORF g.41073 m.41073 type:complete len:476 (-) comp9736_c0_seq1:21-1448(-)
MALCFLYILAVVSCIPRAYTSWNWDRLQVFTYGSNSSCCPYNGTNEHCCSGIDSPDEIEWKLKYDLVMIDNSLGTKGFSKNWPLNETADDGPNCLPTSNFELCNAFKSAVAGAIKQRDPSKVVTVYRETLDCGTEGNGTAPLANPSDLWFNPFENKSVKYGDMWLVDSDGFLIPGACDFRKTVAQDYVLAHNYFGEQFQWLTDDNISGIFIDSGIIMGLRTGTREDGTLAKITVGTRRGMFNGTVTLFKRAAAMLGEHGKFLTVSLKTHFSSIIKTGGGTSGGTLCDPTESPTNIYNESAGCFPYGEEVLYSILGDDRLHFIPFREYNIPSRDFGKGDDTMSPNERRTVQADGCSAAIIDHAMEAQRGPTIACNNDGNSTGGPGPSPYWNITWMEQHAMSLGAFMMGMEEGSYFGSGLHWSDIGWHQWWDEYNHKLGKPLGRYTRDGYLFSRQFECLNVTVNCYNLQTNFKWKHC